MTQCHKPFKLALLLFTVPFQDHNIATCHHNSTHEFKSTFVLLLTSQCDIEKKRTKNVYIATFYHFLILSYFYYDHLTLAHYKYLVNLKD